MPSLEEYWDEKLGNKTEDAWHSQTGHSLRNLVKGRSAKGLHVHARLGEIAISVRQQL